MTKKMVAFILAVMMIMLLTGCASGSYKKAMSLYENGQREEAVAMLAEILNYDDAKVSMHKILYDLIDEEFETSLSDAIDACNNYIDDVKSDYLSWALSGATGSLSFYTTDQNMQTLLHNKNEMNIAYGKIEKIFTPEVLDKCDKRINDAFDKLTEIKDASNSLLDQATLLQLAVNSFNSGEYPYEVEELRDLSLEFTNVKNALIQ